jgi:hypothetical protein
MQFGVSLRWSISFVHDLCILLRQDGQHLHWRMCCGQCKYGTDSLHITNLCKFYKTLDIHFSVHHDIIYEIDQKDATV